MSFGVWNVFAAFCNAAICAGVGVFPTVKPDFANTAANFT
jgi:hypothetical protein